eukprot:GHRR01018379.1.p1 GENE.GHRR01018379.1~~GHRR01018379.1.p1  ORF type:complete len:298 (+),score=157.26 GHRR01018379.1:882-1775(+)
MRVSSLLQKILNQLPKPDAAVQAAPPQPQQPFAAAALEPESAAEAPAPDGDAFWDRSVHVTEHTLPASQQLVPSNSLLPEPSSGGQGTGRGLHGLLMAAQQKHTSAQRAPSVSAPLPTPAATAAAMQRSPSAALPAASSNTIKLSPEPAAKPAAASAAAGAALLTPAFFEQQKTKQQPAPPTPATAPSSSVANVAVQHSPAPVPAVSPVTNGAPSGGNALHKLLSRAAKTTPPAGPAAGGSASAGGAARSQPPQPPLGVLSPEAIKEKVKTALIRLASNDAFVDMLAQEFKIVGLLQ